MTFIIYIIETIDTIWRGSPIIVYKIFHLKLMPFWIFEKKKNTIFEL